MKILGISGSPRIGGNSEILLDRCLYSAKTAGAEITKFILNNMKFVPCQECDIIKKNGKCKIIDDFQNIQIAAEQADAIVVASPIFFGSLSAQTKMMIDRFQCQWLGINLFKSYEILKQKRGAFFCVSAMNKDRFFENAKTIIKNFFATTGTSYKYEILCPFVEKKGDVSNHSDYLQKADEIGKLLSKLPKDF